MKLAPAPLIQACSVNLSRPPRGFLCTVLSNFNWELNARALENCSNYFFSISPLSPSRILCKKLALEKIILANAIKTIKKIPSNPITVDFTSKS